MCDIVGIYTDAGDLTAKYTYDSWGNVTSITDGNGNAITSATHVGNLNPFRYRGYYMDTETGMYYLMSRYYDPVTHRFVNSDGYFQTGLGILDGNMNAYCGNNPINCIDSFGTCSVHLGWYQPTCIICNPAYKIARDEYYARMKKKTMFGAYSSTVYRTDYRSKSSNSYFYRTTVGRRSESYSSYSGNSSAYFSVSSKVRSDDWLSSSVQANLKISDFTLSPHLSFGKYGISGSIASGNTKHALDITANRYSFTLDVEFSSTDTVKWDGNRPIYEETGYTKITYDGKAAATCLATFGVFGLAGYLLVTTLSPASSLG